MQLIAFFLTALVGISLGLVGSGGSILMVPILVYVMDFEPTIATSYSLFIVGVTSSIGAFNNYRKQQISIQTAFLFGLSSIATVFLTRKFLIPLIPDPVMTINGFQFSKSLSTMLLFAMLMLFASNAMIRNTSAQSSVSSHQTSGFFKLFAYGILIGLVTGFLGAGGGFLIIPVLVLILNMPMKTAVGTSLLIIALNTLIGFTGDLGQYEIRWTVLLSLTAISALGIFVGGWLSKTIDGAQLKKAFGWFVLVMGTYIILKELFLQ